MQRARFPARQLNSRTIKSAALGYLSPVFLDSAAFYVQNVFARSGRIALKKHGITFVELETPVTGH